MDFWITQKFRFFRNFPIATFQLHWLAPFIHIHPQNQPLFEPLQFQSTKLSRGAHDFWLSFITNLTFCGAHFCGCCRWQIDSSATSCVRFYKLHYTGWTAVTCRWLLQRSHTSLSVANRASNRNLATSGLVKSWVKCTRPEYIHRNGDMSLLWFYQLPQTIHDVMPMVASPYFQRTNINSTSAGWNEI